MRQAYSAMTPRVRRRQRQWQLAKRSTPSSKTWGSQDREGSILRQDTNGFHYEGEAVWPPLRSFQAGESCPFESLRSDVKCQVQGFSHSRGRILSRNWSFIF